MTPHGLDPVAALRHAIGQPSPPATITQEALDFDDSHLRRLVLLKPGERAIPVDLWDYTQDLLYTEIQGPLLVYLLPFCLQAWREDLRGTNAGSGVFGYGAFVEHFYLALARRHVFAEHLSAAKVAAVSEFMRQSILEEIDDQRGLAYRGMNARPYRWIGALTTHGVLFPDLERLWTDWWSLDTIGRAVGAVQYLSDLMYPKDVNPIFAPWTREGGGGPPCLWEYRGHLYEHRWLEPNVEFLTRTLTAPAVRDLLERAKARLTSEPEHEIAARVGADISARAEMLEARCAELPRLLAKTQDYLFDWSA
jgi:hypothetical protein